MVTKYEEKGIQQGIPLGAQRLIIHQLKRFGPLSEEIENKIKSINDLNKLVKVGTTLLDVKSLEEFVAELDKIK